MKYAVTLVENILDGDIDQAGPGTLPISKFGFTVTGMEFLRATDWDTITDKADPFLHSDIPIKAVSLNKLLATQDNITRKRLTQASRRDGGRADPITVIQYKGKFFIWDGHHRAVAQKIAGQKDILARVVKV